MSSYPQSRLRSMVALAILCALFPIIAIGRPIDQPDVDRIPPESEPVEQVLLTCSTAPPTFAAHAMLTLIEDGAIRNAKRRSLILDQAFELALDAEHPTSLDLANMASLEVRQAMVVDGLSARFDRLSLVCRAIEAQLGDDRVRARDWVGRTPADLWIEPPRCGIETYANPSRFYVTAKCIFEKGFSASERERGMDVFFVEQLIEQSKRPEQLPGLATLITDIDVSADVRERLVDEYAGSLASVESDGQATEFVFSSAKNRDAVFGLGASRTGQKLRSYQSSVAGFLERALGRPHCSLEFFGNDTEPAIWDAYHSAFPNSPVSDEAKRPIRHLAAEKEPASHFQSQRSSAVLRGLQTLRSEREAISNDDQAALARFADRYYDFIDNVAEWNTTEDRNIEDSVAEQTIVAVLLTKIAPSDEAKYAACERVLLLLSQTNPRLYSSAEWWSNVEALSKRTPDAMRPRLLEFLANSSDPRMQIFRAIEVDKFWSERHQVRAELQGK